MFIWLYPSLLVQLSFILERSVGSRKGGPVCPEPRLLSSTKHSAGFKGKCSLGSQVLISPQTDMLLNSLKCQKRWVYLSCRSSWLHMASWATHLRRWPNGHLLHIRSGRWIKLFVKLERCSWVVTIYTYIYIISHISQLPKIITYQQSIRVSSIKSRCSVKCIF